MNLRISLGPKANAGFTLIELMVTLVLMAIIMSLATMALSQFSGYADKSGRGFEARINRYIGLSQLKEVVNRTSDYYVADRLGKTRLFYQGGEREIRFVSTTGWNNESPTLNVLRVENDRANNALEILVLYQKALNLDVFFEESQFPTLDSMTAIVVIDGAKSIRFDYLGLENIRQLYPSGTTDYFYRNLNWQGEYQSQETGYLPFKVRMQVAWPEGPTWPSIMRISAFNMAKRTLMLGGVE